MDIANREEEQKPWCGCGDEITAHDPGDCGTCSSLKDDQIERLRAELVATQASEAKLLEALQWLEQRAMSDWVGRPGMHSEASICLPRIRDAISRFGGE